jgi:hypothetical protein
MRRLEDLWSVQRGEKGCVLRDTDVAFLRMSDQQEEGPGALPTVEDAAGRGAEAVELPQDESFGSERSEPDQGGSAQVCAEEGAAAIAATEQRPPCGSRWTPQQGGHAAIP